MECKECGSETGRLIRGMCNNCYNKWRYRNTDWGRKRREYQKKRYRQKMKEDSDWNARSQREFRKRHPERFNYIMAKSYLRKLSAQKALELFEEFGLGG